jgi:hypothetical protein
MFYWKVNGESACHSELTMDDRLSPPTRCAHKTWESAQKDAQRVQDLYPDACIEIIEGFCDEQNDWLAGTDCE